MTNKAVRDRVFAALKINASYFSSPILGVPATYLDEEVFYSDAPFLKHAPFITTLIANPNHIGVHSFDDHQMEDIFAGTQELETEMLRMVAENMFKGEEKQQDGYVATEALKQIFRHNGSIEIILSRKKAQLMMKLRLFILRTPIILCQRGLIY